MAELQSFSAVARAVGTRRESLRDYLRIRPELDARMREHLRARLTDEQRRENDRRAKRVYEARRRAEDPEGTRRARREHMRSYGPEYRRRWNNYNRLRRAQAPPPDDAAHAYEAVLSGDPCAYCGDAMGHVDHIVPIKRGGTGFWDNLTAACPDCNWSKNASDLLSFLLRRGGGAHVQFDH